MTIRKIKTQLVLESSVNTINPHVIINSIINSIRNTIKGLIISLIILVPAPSYSANQTDIPITIEADQAILKEKKGYSVYQGNVVLTQGNIVFSADEVKVESKNGKLDVMTASGNPVTFKQQLQDQEPISATAQLIKYFAVNQKILLTENATLTQGVNKFTGNRIEYNVATDTVIAGGKVGNPERVKIVIQPTSKPKP